MGSFSDGDEGWSWEGGAYSGQFVSFVVIRSEWKLMNYQDDNDNEDINDYCNK